MADRVDDVTHLFRLTVVPGEFLVDMLERRAGVQGSGRSVALSRWFACEWGLGIGGHDVDAEAASDHLSSRKQELHPSCGENLRVAVLVDVTSSDETAHPSLYDAETVGE